MYKWTNILDPHYVYFINFESTRKNIFNNIQQLEHVDFYIADEPNLSNEINEFHKTLGTHWDNGISN